MTLSDPEVLLELRDEPELLAVADALAETLATSTPAPKRTRRWLPLSAAASLAAAGAAALALVFLGGSVHHGVVDKALAAVGDGPVLHAVLHEKLPTTYSLVEISTGRKIAHTPTRTVEVWFDAQRGLKHTITRTDGVVDDELATPEGITTQDGPVWTCARIAQHPIEATKAGVSCNFNGENGTTPRNVPEPRPTGDPALTGFVDGYREALATGAARKIGSGTVGRTQVYWLEFKLPNATETDGEGVTHLSERVAVSTDTYRPLVVRPITNGMSGDELKVVSIETVSRENANFAKPKRIPRETDAGWNTVDRERIGLSNATGVLGRTALWAGPEVAGQALSLVERREIVSFGAGETSRMPVVMLHYGPVSELNRPTAAVEIVESSEAIPNLTVFPGAPLPPSGFMTIGPFDWRFLRVDGVYVRINGFSLLPDAEDAILAAARQLRPASS
jgi:hypothetical protein